jgi:hypothetical protein
MGLLTQVEVHLKPSNSRPKPDQTPKLYWQPNTKAQPAHLTSSTSLSMAGGAPLSSPTFLPFRLSWRHTRVLASHPCARDGMDTPLGRPARRAVWRARSRGFHPGAFSLFALASRLSLAWRARWSWPPPRSPWRSNREQPGEFVSCLAARATYPIGVASNRGRRRRGRRGRKKGVRPEGVLRLHRSAGATEAVDGSRGAKTRQGERSSTPERGRGLIHQAAPSSSSSLWWLHRRPKVSKPSPFSPSPPP